MALFRHACLIVLLFGLAACQGQTVRPGNSSDPLDVKQASPADVYVELGIEYMKLKKYDVALENLKKAINVDPGSSNAHNVLAVLYEQLGEDKAAGEHFQRAVSLQPSNSSAQNNYGRYLCKNEKYKEADRHFKMALDNPLYRSPILAMTNAGECAFRAGNVETAENYFRSALQINKKFSPALYQMARVKYEQKNYLLVRAYLQRFREVQQMTPAALWLGIQAEDKLSNPDAVASYALQLRQLYPDSHEAGLLEKSQYQ